MSGLPQVASAFAVPPVLMGPEPVLDTPRKKGDYLRAQCRAMGLDFDQWPEEAQRVEVEDYEARMPSLWERLREWWWGR